MIGARRPRVRTSRAARLATVALIAATLLGAASASHAGSAELTVNGEWSFRGHNGAAYQATYAGGCADCYLTASITYKSKSDLGIRVTSPTGEVREFNTRGANQQFEYAYWAPELAAGTWSVEAYGSPGTRVSFTVRLRDGSA